jgi:hypothetical protein
MERTIMIWKMQYHSYLFPIFYPCYRRKSLFWAIRCPLEFEVPWRIEKNDDDIQDWDFTKQEKNFFWFNAATSIVDIMQNFSFVYNQ